jgi:hypothetical protein
MQHPPLPRAPATALTPPASEAPASTVTLEDLSLGAARPWLTPLSLVIAALAGLTFFAAADDFYTVPTRLYSALSAAVLAILGFRYVATRPPRLPWIEFFYAIHFMQFGLSIAGEPVPVGFVEAIPSPRSHETAATLAFFSGLAMIATFTLIDVAATRRRAANRLLPKLDADTLVAGSGLYVGVSAMYVLVTSYARSLHQSMLVIANITDGLFAVGPLVTLAAAGYLTRPHPMTRIRFWAAIGAMVAAVAASSMLNNVAFPVAGLLILLWRARERVPWVAAGVATVALVILQPVKAYYRDLQWTEHAGLNVVDAWSQAFKNAAADTQSGFGRERQYTMRARLSALTALAFVTDVVPASVPHGDGEVYPVLGYSVIPRVVWPEKPNMTKAGLDRFTIALGLTDESTADRSTTGITLAAQGYYEHGPVGSIAWGMLLGAVLGLLSAFCGSGLAGTIAGSVLLMSWPIAVDGGFINCFGGLWQALFAATALTWAIWWLGRRKSRMAVRAPVIVGRRT